MRLRQRGGDKKPCVIRCDVSRISVPMCQEKKKSGSPWSHDVYDGILLSAGVFVDQTRD